MPEIRSTTPTTKRFGPFVLHERVGSGGSATVYRATWQRDDGHELEVGLKRLHRHLTDDETAVSSFIEEARIAAAMRHANICRVLDAGRLGHDYFIAMEYIRGTKLGSLLRAANERERPPTLPAMISLVIQLCDALEYAHTRIDQRTGQPLGLVHRDVSPANVLVTSGGVLKLIDLGIAKSRASEYDTATGVIKGTMGYIAPEVVRGGKADTRADIFSAGVIAWELLCARRLFAGATEPVIMQKVVTCHVPPPSRWRADCPLVLDEVILRALARRPEHRWPSASAMAGALRAAAAALHVEPAPEEVAAWLRALSRRSRRRSELPLEPETTTSTTAVWQRPHTELPEPPGRFASGTEQKPALTMPVTAPPPPPQRPWAIVASAIAGVLLGVAIFAGVTAPESNLYPTTHTPVPVPVPVPVSVAHSEDADQPTKPNKPKPKPKAEAKPKPKPKPKPEAKPKPKPAGTVVAATTKRLVPESALAVLAAKHPVSRSTTGPYTARVCIGTDGGVTSVTVLEGPKGYHRRIARYVSRWRYAPYRPAGAAEPVSACTIVEDRLRDWKGSY